MLESQKATGDLYAATRDRGGVRDLLESFGATASDLVSGLEIYTPDGRARDLPLTPFPFVVTRRDSEQLKHVCAMMHGILDKIVDAFVAGDPALRGFFRRYEPFIPWMKKQGPFWVRMLRCDFISDTAGVLRFVEFNTSPGAFLVTPIVQKAFMEFLEKNRLPVARVESQPFEKTGFFPEKIQGWEARSGFKPKAVAILYDSHNLRFELYELEKQLKAAGRDTAVRDVASLEYSGGALRMDGREVSLAYNNFFLTGTHMKLDAPSPWRAALDAVSSHPYGAFLRAVKDGAFLLTHGLAELCLVEDKSVMTVLSDPRFSHLFTDDEKMFLKMHIPSSTPLAAAMSDAGERKRVLDEKDRLVFKLDTSGKGMGVKFGRECSREEWERLLSGCAHPAVLQERIDPFRFTLSFLENDGSVAEGAFNTVMSFYCYEGEMAGLVSRLSTSLTVNLSGTARYFMQPVVVTE
jgi:hypothetical protein